MSQLKVLKASAGSGKTFNLTLEYLKLALSGNPRYFSRILGMTFTNKAAGEMKENILEELNKLAVQPESSPHYKALTKSLGLPAGKENAVLKTRAEKARRAILLNYHDFSLSTIDSFFQRIVRAFFRELKLASNFDVELNQDEVISNAIDDYLFTMEEDDPLIEQINAIQDQLIRDEKSSQNYKKELKKLAGELFRELDFSVSARSEKELGDYKKKLVQEMKGIEGRFLELRDQLREELEKFDVTAGDFSGGKSRSIPVMILNRDEDKMMEILDKATIQSKLELEDAWVKKSEKGERREQLMNACNACMPIALEIKEFLTENKENYITNKLLLENYLSYEVLSKVEQIINNYLSQENIFLLGKTYQLLRNFVTESDSPLVYERIGNHYKHIFIDEFQDTSRYQYDNIKPLLTESLSTGNYNLIVGDIKQAIYRFRNGDWALLGSQVERDFGAVVNEEKLLQNWRSREEIINFNNDLFPVLTEAVQQHLTGEMEAAEFRPDEPVTFQFLEEIYREENVKQQYPEKAKVRGKGHIQMEFMAYDPEEVGQKEAVEVVYERLEEQLLQLEKKGYSAGDIAILSRGKNDIKDLIPLLANSAQKFPESRIFDFFSEEVLTVSDSPAVQMVLSVFRLTAYGIQDPKEKRRMMLQLGFFAQKAGLKRPFEQKGKWPGRGELKLPHDLDELVQSGASLGLDGFYKKVLKVLDLGSPEAKGQFYYLSALEDEISDYASKNGNDLIGFLEYWDDKGSSKTIEPPGGADKMQLMTIHKSKGLSFEIVILPFANTELRPDFSKTNILWVEDKRSANGESADSSVFPVKMKGDMKDSAFRYDFWKEYYDHFTDEINNFYVATTRPRQALFVYAFEKQRKKADFRPHCLQDHLLNFASEKMHEKGEAETDHRIFVSEKDSWEALSPPPEKESRETEPTFELKKLEATGTLPEVKGSWRPNPLSSSTPEERHAVEVGLILHRILELVNVKSEIPAAIRTVIEEGMIGRDEKEHWKERINAAMGLDPVSEWFDETLEVMNERDILIPGGKRYRPDRVVIDNQKAVVIDYKTGSEHPSHNKQIETYTKALSQMGYTEVEGWLFYTDILKTRRVV